MLAGRGFAELVDLDLAMGSRRSMLGRRPSSDGLEEEGWRAWMGKDWNDGGLGAAAGRECVLFGVPVRSNPDAPVSC